VEGAGEYVVVAGARVAHRQFRVYHRPVLQRTSVPQEKNIWDYDYAENGDSRKECQNKKKKKANAYLLLGLHGTTDADDVRDSRAEVPLNVLVVLRGVLRLQSECERCR
jgi:hypothetical protein